MQKLSMLLMVFALPLSSSAEAGGSRSVLRAGNGRVLIRQSQHACSANEVAFWQGVTTELGQTARTLGPLLLSKSGAAGGAGVGAAGATPAAVEPVKPNKTLTDSEKLLDETFKNYRDASKKAETAITALQKKLECAKTPPKEKRKIEAEIKEITRLKASVEIYSELEFKPLPTDMAKPGAEATPDAGAEPDLGFDPTPALAPKAGQVN